MFKKKFCVLISPSDSLLASWRHWY